MSRTGLLCLAMVATVGAAWAGAPALDVPGESGSFDPTGRWLAVATNRSTTLWDLQTLARVRGVPGSSHEWSPDGRWLATSDDNGAWLTDLVDGGPPRRMARCISEFDPKHHRALVCDGELSHWALVALPSLQTLRDFEGSASFAASGRWLVVQHWPGAALVDAETLDLVRTLPDGQLSGAPLDRWYTVAQDGKTQVRETATGRVVTTLDGSDPVFAGGYVGTTHEDRHDLWRQATWEHVCDLPDALAAASDDGRIVLLSDAHYNFLEPQVTWFEVATKRVITAWYGQLAGETADAWVVQCGQRTSEHDIATGRRLRVLRGSEDHRNAAGWVLTATAPETLERLDPDHSPEPLGILGRYLDSDRAARWLVQDDDDAVSLWDLAARRRLQSVPDADQGKISANGLVWATSDHGSWQANRVADGRPLGRCDGEGLQFAPDGTTAVTRDGAENSPTGLVRVIDGKLLADTSSEQVGYSPDGAFLSASGHQQIRLIRCADGVVLHTWHGAQSLFRPDGRAIAVRIQPDAAEAALYALPDLSELARIAIHDLAWFEPEPSDAEDNLRPGAGHPAQRLKHHEGGFVALTDQATGRERWRIEAHDPGFTPDGRWLVGQTHYYRRIWPLDIWRADDGRRMFHGEGYEFARALPDGTLIVQHKGESHVLLWRPPEQKDLPAAP